MGSARLYQSAAVRRWLGGLIISLITALLIAAIGLLPLAAQPPATVPAPTRTPSPTAANETPTLTVACPDAPPNRLVVGERGRVVVDDPRPLNIRAGAGTSNAIIGQIPTQGLFVVLDGPRCSQRYAWYQVSYRDPATDDTTDGWIAEGDVNVYFVELYPPGW